MPKKIIPSLDLNSKDFEKKVIYSLKETGNVRINPSLIYSNEEGDMDRFAFALMNTFSSKRKHCMACGGKHYFFMDHYDDSQEDETGLCERCGVFLQNMVLFGVEDKKKIQEWMKSEGKIDPYELMREAVDKKVKDGEINMEKKEFEYKKDDMLT